ncbi:MAG: hypothetical protein ACTJH9_07735 [Pseudoalteromonas sp.]|uniref:hypothetical protein n=1 Tax=unclassified Pseudoalteromonas TaxID=194690 RepID=UPI003F9D2080
MLILLVTLCWLPQFNLYIIDFIDQTLLQSSLVYASARGVNGAISLLQSAEVGIGIASIEPAQLLDPVNDLAEYIAGVMRFAIGSLFIQRILYTVSSGLLFNITFSVGAVVYIACDYRGYLKNINSRLLTSLIILRFLVPAIILATGLASHAFLDKEIDSQNSSVEDKVAVIQASASSTSALSAQVKAKINSQKQTLLDEVELLNTQIMQLTNRVKSNQRDITNLTEKIDAIQTTRTLTEKLTLTELDEAKPLIIKQQDLKRQQSNLNNQLAKLGMEKAALMRELADYNDQLSGNSNSNISRIIDAVTSGINNMLESVENLFMDFLNLVALLSLKLLLIPLLFLYLFKKVFGVIWRTTPPSSNSSVA